MKEKKFTIAFIFLASCCPTPVNKDQRRDVDLSQRKKMQDEPKLVSDKALSAKDHVAIGRDAFERSDYDLAEAHGRCALKKDIYSREARNLLEDIAMRRSPYFRAAVNSAVSILK